MQHAEQQPDQKNGIRERIKAVWPLRMKAVTADWRVALGAMPPDSIAVFQPAVGPLAGRRIARALLEEAAVLGGGRVVALPGGDLLLGRTAAPGQRAVQAIATLLGQAPRAWPLPLGQAAVEGAASAAEQSAASPIWSLASLEAHCATLPLRAFARLTLFADGGGERAVAQRLSTAPLGLEDEQLEAAAREWLCRRLLSALTNPAERAGLPALRPGLRLILDLPLNGLGQGAPLRGAAADDPNGPIALLPLAALGEGGALAQRLAGLRQAGWAVGLLAPDAVALDWVNASEFIWAAPAGPVAPAHLPPRMIALGAPAPAWCRAPGIFHEGINA